MVSMLERASFPRRGIDIKPDHVAIGIEIDIEPLDNLPRLGARHALQLDIETVGLGINNAASWPVLAEIAVEECVVDRLAADR
jgi:hypothetical protein